MFIQASGAKNNNQRAPCFKKKAERKGKVASFPQESNENKFENKNDTKQVTLFRLVLMLSYLQIPLKFLTVWSSNYFLLVNVLTPQQLPHTRTPPDASSTESPDGEPF